MPFRNTNGLTNMISFTSDSKFNTKYEMDETVLVNNKLAQVYIIQNTSRQNIATAFNTIDRIANVMSTVNGHMALLLIAQIPTDTDYQFPSKLYKTTVLSFKSDKTFICFDLTGAFEVTNESDLLKISHKGSIYFNTSQNTSNFNEWKELTNSKLIENSIAFEGDELPD